MKLWPVAPFFSLTFGWVFFSKREQARLSSSLFKKKAQPKVSEKKGQPVRVSFGNKLLLTELVLYYDTSSRLVFVHFLEEIEDTKKYFRNYLTFRSQVQSIKFEDKVLLCWLVLRPQMVGVPAPLAFWSTVKVSWQAPVESTVNAATSNPVPARMSKEWKSSLRVQTSEIDE